MSEPVVTGKPPSRRWLFLPYGLIAAALIAYGAGWFVVKGRIEAGMDAAAANLRAQGYQVSWSARSFSGFPFRLHLVLKDVALAAPSGWAARFDDLSGEAYLHAPGHWVLAANQGLTLTRPGSDGAVAIRGQAIRASLNGLDAPIWKVAVEGIGLTFTPASGAKPFSLADAARIELYTRQSPDHTGAAEALVRFDQVHLAPDALLGRRVGRQAVTGAFALRMTRAATFAGPGWTAAGQNWARSDGRIEIDPTTAPTGDGLALAVPAGSLRLGQDGRPSGALTLALSARNAPPLALPLRFEDGKTRMGPLTLGPAPRLF